MLGLPDIAIYTMTMVIRVESSGEMNTNSLYEYVGMLMIQQSLNIQKITSATSFTPMEMLELKVINLAVSDTQ